MSSINALAATASRCVKWFGRGCGVEEIFEEIKRAVPRALGITDGRLYEVKLILMSFLVLVSVMVNMWISSVAMKFFREWYLRVMLSMLMVAMLICRFGFVCVVGVCPWFGPGTGRLLRGDKCAIRGLSHRM